MGIAVSIAWIIVGICCLIHHATKDADVQARDIWAMFGAMKPFAIMYLITGLPLALSEMLADVNYVLSMILLVIACIGILIVIGVIIYAVVSCAIESSIEKEIMRKNPTPEQINHVIRRYGIRPDSIGIARAIDIWRKEELERRRSERR